MSIKLVEKYVDLIKEAKGPDDLQSEIAAVLRTIYEGQHGGWNIFDEIDVLNDYFDEVEESNDDVLQRAYFYWLEQSPEDRARSAGVTFEAIELLASGK